MGLEWLEHSGWKVPGSKHIRARFSASSILHRPTSNWVHGVELGVWYDEEGNWQIYLTMR